MPSVDFHLDKEIAKATTMLLTFKNTLGEEKIPHELLDVAKGVVFLTIVKVGFMFTGRYGTGVIVAKLPDGRWSAPSALMITGLGWGLQIGAEVTDVMLILSTDHAVNTFKSKAQVAVGAELGVSVGPVGRSIGSDVAASNKGAAHAFSYAQAKGLFFGASLEASAIAARPDVNRAFYGERVSITSLLNGEYPPPKGAEPLYKAIDEVLFDGIPSGSTFQEFILAK
jgi:lipid-binding SYLF domain-containing protein